MFAYSLFAETFENALMFAYIFCIFRSRLFTLYMLLVALLMVEGLPNRVGGGGGYAQVGGRSVGGGYVRGPGGRTVVYGGTGGNKNGEFDAKGGFVAGGGSVSAGQSSGYSNGIFHHQ